MGSELANLSTLLLLAMLFRSSLHAAADNSPPECPYPCLPPPTSMTGYPPPPPASPSGSVYAYPPPPPATPDYENYPPPSGYVPYLSPPYVSYTAPPPPNPIVPWFPFYFRTPPSPSSSASPAIPCVAAALFTISLLGILLF